MVLAGRPEAVGYPRLYVSCFAAPEVYPVHHSFVRSRRFSNASTLPSSSSAVRSLSVVSHAPVLFAARDVQTRMHPLTYTAPVSKADYLGGRFLAGFIL